MKRAFAGDGSEPRSKIRPIAFPGLLRQEFPISPEARETVQAGRSEVRRVLAGEDDRVLLVVGLREFNCNSALEFAKRLQGARIALGRSLLILMRVSLPSPGASCGASCAHSGACGATSAGLREARSVLSTITSWGVPCAIEVRDEITQFFFGDLASWALAEETDTVMASSLAMPVGFKSNFNAVARALDAIEESREGDVFIGFTRSGTLGLMQSKGNADCHVVVPEPPPFSPALHLLKREMRKRRVLGMTSPDSVAGILIELGSQGQVSAIQRICEAVREDSLGHCGALVAADLNFSGLDCFAFIDLQLAMQDLVIAVEDRRALRSGLLGSTPEEIAEARNFWRTAPPEEVDHKYVKAFGLCDGFACTCGE
jgi:hypothetical protein